MGVRRRAEEALEALARVEFGDEAALPADDDARDVAGRVFERLRAAG